MGAFSFFLDGIWVLFFHHRFCLQSSNSCFSVSRKKKENKEILSENEVFHASCIMDVRAVGPADHNLRSSTP